MLLCGDDKKGRLSLAGLFCAFLVKGRYCIRAKVGLMVWFAVTLLKVKLVSAPL
jgi:hypothetical protein